MSNSNPSAATAPSPALIPDIFSVNGCSSTVDHPPEGHSKLITGQSITDANKPLSQEPVPNFDGVRRAGIGTQRRIDEGSEEAKDRLKRMCGAVRTLLECVGENPNREGLLATPSRYAKALLFLTKGYQMNIDDVVNKALFDEGHSDMVIVKDIEIHSLCEHHLGPFTGKVQFIQVHTRSL